LTLAVALPCSWLATEMRWSREQAATAEWVRGLGGQLLYEYEFYVPSGVIINAEPLGPVWLRELLGKDFFADVAYVCFSSPYNPRVGDAELERLSSLTQLRELQLWGGPLTPDGLAHLKRLTRLEKLQLNLVGATDAGVAQLGGLHRLRFLNLFDNCVTDAGLAHLTGLTQLQELDVTFTSVTAEGVKKLQEALPNCKILGP
jgi:hypothetical protein